MRGRPRLLPLIAAGLVAAVDIFYLTLISREKFGGGIDSRVRFVAASLATAALLAVAGGLLKRGLAAVVAFGASASILLTWAFLAIFTIGILIAVPGFLVLASLTQAFDDDSVSERWFALAAVAATLAVTIFGLNVT